MTENEAIERIKKESCYSENCHDGCLYGEENCAYSKAISALKEIKQYHAIGTAEECLEAMKNYKSIVCSSAEKDSDGKCLGYGKSDIDDEPCKICKNCKKSTGYLEGEM